MTQSSLFYQSINIWRCLLLTLLKAHALLLLLGQVQAGLSGQASHVPVQHVPAPINPLLLVGRKPCPNDLATGPTRTSAHQPVIISRPRTLPLWPWQSSKSRTGPTHTSAYQPIILSWPRTVPLWPCQSKKSHTDTGPTRTCAHQPVIISRPRTVPLWPCQSSKSHTGPTRTCAHQPLSSVGQEPCLCDLAGQASHVPVQHVPAPINPLSSVDQESCLCDLASQASHVGYRTNTLYLRTVPLWHFVNAYTPRILINQIQLRLTSSDKRKIKRY